MKTLTIDEYMNLTYKTTVEELWDEYTEKPYYIAYHEEFGRNSCSGRGETADEALASLRDEKYDLISILLEKGLAVPEPLPQELDGLPSGKFSVRTNPMTHRRLMLHAKRMGVSLNLLVNQMLSEKIVAEEIKQHIDKRFDRMETHIDKCMERYTGLLTAEIERKLGAIDRIHDSHKYQHLELSVAA